jgi:hypothetical protein
LSCDLLVGSIADNSHGCRVFDEPAQGRGVEFDGDDDAAVTDEPLDHGASHATAAARDDVGAGDTARRHRAFHTAQPTRPRGSL